MNNIIYLNEVRIELALKKAEASLIKAKTMIIEGKIIPEDLIPKLEAVIIDLEEQLIKLVENNPLA